MPPFIAQSETTPNERFINVDPLIKQYPELTPYQFASNTPIKAVDLDGLEAAEGEGERVDDMRYVDPDLIEVHDKLDFEETPKPTYRVARRAQCVDANGQGAGWEYGTEDGQWYKQSELKSGKNPDAANDTHISLKNNNFKYE